MAANALDQFLAASRPIRCDVTERDRYQRLVAVCFRADGRDGWSKVVMPWTGHDTAMERMQLPTRQLAQGTSVFGAANSNSRVRHEPNALDTHLLVEPADEPFVGDQGNRPIVVTSALCASKVSTSRSSPFVQAFQSLICTMTVSLSGKM